jgi:hypothetical protein
MTTTTRRPRAPKVDPAVAAETRRDKANARRAAKQVRDAATLLDPSAKRARRPKPSARAARAGTWTTDTRTGQGFSVLVGLGVVWLISPGTAWTITAGIVLGVGLWAVWKFCADLKQQPWARSGAVKGRAFAGRRMSKAWAATAPDLTPIRDYAVTLLRSAKDRAKAHAWHSRADAWRTARKFARAAGQWSWPTGPDKPVQEQSEPDAPNANDEPQLDPEPVPRDENPKIIDHDPDEQPRQPGPINGGNPMNYSDEKPTGNSGSNGTHGTGDGWGVQARREYQNVPKGDGQLKLLSPWLAEQAVQMEALAYAAKGLANVLATLELDSQIIDRMSLGASGAMQLAKLLHDTSGVVADLYAQHIAAEKSGTSVRRDYALS